MNDDEIWKILVLYYILSFGLKNLLFEIFLFFFGVLCNFKLNILVILLYLLVYIENINVKKFKIII